MNKFWNQPAEADGNVSAAARRLDVSRSTLYRRLEQLDLQASVKTDQ